MDEQTVFYEFDTDISITKLKNLIEDGEISGLKVGALNDSMTRMEVSDGNVMVIFFESAYTFEEKHEKTLMIRVNEEDSANEIFGIIEDYFNVPVMLMGG